MNLFGLVSVGINTEKQLFRDFLKEYPEYGKTKKLDNLRKQDFSRLDEQKHVYLDFTGGHLYPESLVEWHGCFLKSSILGNPHSQNPSSSLSEKYITYARNKVLEFFNCGEDYLCIFTSNATAAIKIIGECYPFEKSSQLLLTTDNHNSVNGLREYARQREVNYSYSPLDLDSLTLSNTDLQARLTQPAESANKLFAYPAQSNVSGIQHDLKWISYAKDQGWDVLLDAAAFVPSNQLDLQKHQPDFVSLSFYKMFGYPTGLGCLLVKKSSFEKLEKPAFTGGTITIVSVKGDGYYLESDEARFEDGTVDYLNIPAISKGLEYLESIGLDTIKKRVSSLTNFLYHYLQNLKHSNGQKLIEIYGSANPERQGGTLTLNFFDCNGNLHDFLKIEQMAFDWNISLRTGCFCNPGIDESNHKLSAERLRSYFQQEGQKDYFDLIQYLGKRRGAVRISIGYLTNFHDIHHFIQFCQSLLDKTYSSE